MSEYLPLLLFALVFLIILSGYPVALVLGGISVVAGLLLFDAQFFYLLSLRIYGIMQNFVLLSVPLFVFMGLMLEKSGIAERLLLAMSQIFGRYKGGLALSVVLVGAMLAASTGIVGATVVTMGLISLPTLLKAGYSPQLATGTIASAGTLGQIIPPSVVLVLLGSVMNISVGDLFLAAVVPGLGLVIIYMIYLRGLAFFTPEKLPAVSLPNREDHEKQNRLWETLLLPFLLIIAVLGSIFAGIASPTEAAGVGAIGAILLALYQRRLSLPVVREVSLETTRITSMVFLIMIGASAFSLVFRGLEGEKVLINFIKDSDLSPNQFLLLVMLLVFLAGFFIDFIEIIFIIVPIITPILQTLGIDKTWVAIMLAINLQTSFLTPPFGFALFYLKGVAPPTVTTRHIYEGIVPFVILQLLFLLLIFLFPQILHPF